MSLLFHGTRVVGARQLVPDKKGDERGFFARTWCVQEAQREGLDPVVAQCSTSWNPVRGTLRGLHYLEPSYGEAKLVRCTRGRIWDVMVDLRQDSLSYLQWDAYELSAQNGRSVYLPPGVAHGFLTLEPDTEVYYQMSRVYESRLARTARWDDPTFRIPWPFTPKLISPSDANAPLHQVVA